MIKIKEATQDAYLEKKNKHVYINSGDDNLLRFPFSHFSQQSCISKDKAPLGGSVENASRTFVNRQNYRETVSNYQLDFIMALSSFIQAETNERWTNIIQENVPVTAASLVRLTCYCSFKCVLMNALLTRSRKNQLRDECCYFLLKHVIPPRHF